MNHQHLIADLKSLINPEKAAFLPKFFKTGPGQYGEGDQFIGVVVPNQRKIAKKYKNLPLAEIQKLIISPIHEHRLTSLFILVHQFQKGDGNKQKEIYEFYLKNKHQVNNWDLVDSSAHKIVGAYLLNKDRSILYELAHSPNLWDRRIAMISCFAFTDQEDFEDALAIADILVNDEHDLIHKAVGWVLREVGKKDQRVEEEFLMKHYKTMPRTMLRYAIEKFTRQKRDFYLGK